MVLLNISIKLGLDFLFTGMIGCLSKHIFALLHDIEEVDELVEVLLTQWSAQVNYKSQRDNAEDILVQVFTQLRHAFY